MQARILPRAPSLGLNMNKANFFWSGNPLQKRNFASFNSFLAHGWDVTVWTYDTDLPLSPEINVRNASEILDPSRLGTFTYDNCNVNEVPFSDLFRLYVMQYTDGWWFDTDCFCLRDYSDFDLLTYNRYFVSAWEFSDSINNAVLYFNNKQLLADLITFTENEIEPQMIWGKIGPRCLSKFLFNYDLTYQVLPSWSLYAVAWDDALKGTQDEYIDYMKELCKPSLIYHYYNSVCQREEPRGYIKYMTDLYS